MKPTINNPVQLAEVVQHQEGAVVSQTLLKEKSGSVTAFAFDAGQGLSEHTSPYDALLYLLDGQATVSVSGVAHLLSAGQLIRLPANAPHAVHSHERFKMLLIMIRPT